MRDLTWVIKTSKQCNLRCSYCYEWNELSDPRRMALADWQRLLGAMREHRALEQRRFGGLPARLTLVLHGGEPLLLPVEYLETILSMARDASAPGGAAADRIALQTNLYALSDAHLDLLERFSIDVGVSLDLVPGVRVSVTGKETEARVLRNLARLRERELRVGGIAVIAKHTAPHVRFIYRFFREQRLSLRVLPLFRGPEQRPYEAFGLDDASIVAALETLFACWMEDDERIPITPFADYFEVTLRALSGARVAEYDRARHGDGVLLVNTNGDLYCTADAYLAEHRLGNVFAQSYREIVASDAYTGSLRREAERREGACGGCRYRGACSTWPLFETRSELGPDGRCSIASRCYAFMEAWLHEHGFGAPELARMLESSVQT